MEKSDFGPAFLFASHLSTL